MFQYHVFCYKIARLHLININININFNKGKRVKEREGGQGNVSSEMRTLSYLSYFLLHPDVFTLCLCKRNDNPSFFFTSCTQVDFFRQVNKDAYKLRRLGSDGVTSCSTVICRGFASCLARIGLGNPSVSLQQMAFDKGDPLSITADQKQTSPAGHQRQYSGDSGLIDEEWDEDEEAIDGQTLSEQVLSARVTEFSCLEVLEP